MTYWFRISRQWRQQLGIRHSARARKKRRLAEVSPDGDGTDAGIPMFGFEQGQYLRLKAYLVGLAVHRRREWLEEQFRALSYEPYAPFAPSSTASFGR